MADIFVSYKREDRDRVEPLARALESEGFSVWWDPELPIGQSYASSIRTALNEAQAVIPVWTALSVQSEWVQEEATHAKRRGVLFPVRLDAIDPPIGFTMVETADLIDWQEGDADHEEWARLLQQLRAKLLGPATPPAGEGNVVIKRRRSLRQLFGNRMGSIAGGAAILLAVIATIFLIGREPDAPSDGTPATAASGSAPASDASGARPAAAEGPPVPREVPAPAVAAGANSSIAQARQLALGVAEPGEILTTDDTRVYAVPNALKLRDLAVVRLENESTTLRPYVKIFNADRSQVAEAFDGSAGASVQHVLPLTPGQPIYVQVLPYNTIGKYRISVTPQKAYDTFEPNDTLLTPAAAKVGTDIDAGVMDNKDPDFYRFSGAPARMVKVTFENLSTTLRPYLRVYDGNKSMILERFDGTPGANLNFDVDLKQSRDFYIAVNPYSTSGKYRLRVD